jgi:hypothetical protein
MLTLKVISNHQWLIGQCLIVSVSKKMSSHDQKIQSHAFNLLKVIFTLIILNPHLFLFSSHWLIPPDTSSYVFLKFKYSLLLLLFPTYILELFANLICQGTLMSKFFLSYWQMLLNYLVLTLKHSLESLTILFSLMFQKDNYFSDSI